MKFYEHDLQREFSVVNFFVHNQTDDLSFPLFCLVCCCFFSRGKHFVKCSEKINFHSWEKQFEMLFFSKKIAPKQKYNELDWTCQAVWRRTKIDVTNVGPSLDSALQTTEIIFDVQTSYPSHQMQFRQIIRIVMFTFKCSVNAEQTVCCWWEESEAKTEAIISHFLPPLACSNCSCGDARHTRSPIRFRFATEKLYVAYN